MYTNVRNVQILISLLKQYGIRHFVNSPGTRNTPLVHSIEEDPFFKCYSIVDERSAAYFALGLSEALDVPVCITCTAATATCNYMPAIKEAYERGIQLVALTGDRELYTMFHMQDQSINQINMYDGYIKYSVDIPSIKNSDDAWYANRSINEALLELNHNGKGPIQINYRVPSWGVFDVNEIPIERKIERLENNKTNWKEIEEKLKNKKRIIVFAGSYYSKEIESLNQKIKQFYDKYNSVIFIDHYSNLEDKEFINIPIISEAMTNSDMKNMYPDLIITYGNIFYPPIKGLFNGIKQNFEHWHIATDGMVNDGFRNLTNLFVCSPVEFFENTVNTNSHNDKIYKKLWADRLTKAKYQQMPFTNFTAIRDLVKNIPENSFVHMSVLDSIRISNYYHFNNKNIKCFANTGADGIDGAFSTFLGQAKQTKDLAFLIIGDLSYLYDLNAILKVTDSNIRIMVVNNYAGAEFHKNFGLKMIPTLNLHIAAGHHTKIQECSKISDVEYMDAKNQEELNEALNEFVKPSSKPIILEVFTNADTDANTLKEFWKVNKSLTFKSKVKEKIKGMLGTENIKSLKKILGKG